MVSSISCNPSYLRAHTSHSFPPYTPLWRTKKEHTQHTVNQVFLIESWATAMAFAGTTQKCMACDKTVYLVDKLTADNRVYHKACFRCHHCKGTLKVWAFKNSCTISLCMICFELMSILSGWKCIFSCTNTLICKFLASELGLHV